jgi:hypothetical protein
MKTCTQCLLEKDESEFRPRPGKYSHLLRAACRECEKVCSRSRMREARSNGYESLYKAARPWLKHYRNAYKRCRDKNHLTYPSYGGKDIQLLMKPREFKVLWFRDNAAEMENPEIDRKDPQGHYIFHNCRFLPRIENRRRAGQGACV